MKKVIAAGHICLDITPIFPCDNVSKIGDVLKPGRLISIREAEVHTGGCVANTGLAMKLLGADVSLVSKIGKDVFGDMVLNILREHHAEEDMVVVEEDSTSYSIVLAVPGVDRMFLHNSGANDSFTIEDIPEEILRDAALLHFGYPPLMKQMYQNNGAELVRLMRNMKERGIATSLDMTSVDPGSPAGKAEWKVILKNVLPYIDFFEPSIEELCYMLDPGRYVRWQKQAADGDITEVPELEEGVKALADQCMELGVKVLLIKCGARGIYYRTAGKSELDRIGKDVELDSFAWADKEGFEKSYVPEKVLSGTGAGDVSIAAFLTSLLGGYSTEECVQFATAAGACCVAAYDALSGLKPLSELKEMIQAGWKKSSF